MLDDSLFRVVELLIASLTDCFIIREAYSRTLTGKDQHFMLAVQKWAQGKHPVIGMVAPFIASHADSLYELYSSFKDRKINGLTTELPDLSTWYSLYRNHRRYFDCYGEFILSTSPLMQEFATFGNEVQELREELKTASRIPTPEEASHIQTSSNKLKQTLFDELKADFDTPPIAPEARDTGLDSFNTHMTEIHFFFFVFTPCLIFYKTNPGRLYHRARLGDVKAIDALLRLDPFMLHDPAIGKRIQKIRLTGKRSTYTNLVEAPLKPIKAKINKSRVKAILGSLISMIAAEYNAPLLSTDLRKLYDALAQDAKQYAVDTSLPNSDEAFYKLLQRNRDDWKKIIPAGQKKVKVVSG